MVMYANDFETKEKQKLPEKKKLTATDMLHVKIEFMLTFFNLGWFLISFVL